MLNTRVLLKMIALFVMAQGCQQAAPPAPPAGPTSVEVVTPKYSQFQIVDAKEDGAVAAALQQGWVLVNCSVGVGAYGAGRRTSVREHCYLVREGAPATPPAAPGADG